MSDDAGSKYLEIIIEGCDDSIAQAEGYACWQEERAESEAFLPFRDAFPLKDYKFNIALKTNFIEYDDIEDPFRSHILSAVEV